MGWKIPVTWIFMGFKCVVFFFYTKHQALFNYISGLFGKLVFKLSSLSLPFIIKFGFCHFDVWGYPGVTFNVSTIEYNVYYLI